MDLLFRIESFDAFQAVVEKLFNIHKSEAIPLTDVHSNIITLARDELRKIISSNNFDLNKVTENIQSGNWDQEKVKWFLPLLQEQKTKLFYILILDHNSKYGETVSDYDWLLKFVFGTSDSKMLKYPLLQLLLTTINPSDEQKKSVFDFNKDLLCKLITALENCEEIN